VLGERRSVITPKKRIPKYMRIHRGNETIHLYNLHGWVLDECENIQLLKFILLLMGCVVVSWLDGYSDGEKNWVA